jgi:Cu-processing system permease protein
MTSISPPLSDHSSAREFAVAGAKPKRHVSRSVALFQARNVLRSRWLAAYAAFFLLTTEGLLRFSGSSAGTILSLANIVLYIVPLATLLVGTVYLYNAREFIELLLAQPVHRARLFAGLYAGLAAPLALSIWIGAGTPFLLRGFASAAELAQVMTVLTIGTALTLSFAGIALALALRCDDRLRGLSVSIGIWLLGALVYDGIVLTLVASFSDYPLERPILALTFLNPIDLARVAVLLQLDVSALMGYTGAVFQQFLGGAAGMSAALLSLGVWIVVPFAFGLRTFSRKDF